MNWNRLAELLALLSAVLLWRQAHRASLIKLARAQFVPTDKPTTRLGKIKQWLGKRQERREQNWTESDHRLLIAGLAFAALASLIKLWIA